MNLNYCILSTNCNIAELVNEWMSLAALCGCVESPHESALQAKNLYISGEGVIHSAAWVTHQSPLTSDSQGLMQKCQHG